MINEKSFTLDQKIDQEMDQELQEQFDKIKKRAEKIDVTFDLFRWFRGRMMKNDPELLEIQKKGFRSEAVAFLESTTPEGMKFGSFKKEERFVKAREFADKAQISIEELAEELGINLE